MKDSILLHDDIFEELKLYEAFIKAIPHFDRYSPTPVTPEEWNRLKESAVSFSAEQKAVIAELDTWVCECLKTEKLFTILGI